MLKIIKTLAISLSIWIISASSLSAQSFVDLSLEQLLSPDSVLFCSSKEIPIKAIIKLSDGMSLDSFQISYQLDNRTTITEKVKRKISFNDTIHYEFAKFLSKDSLINGSGSLKVSIATYSSNTDYRSFNNTKILSFRNSLPKILPYSMNFESNTLPPIDWAGIKANYYTPGNGGYIKDYVRGIDDNYGNSLVFQNNNSPVGELHVVKSPLFDIGNADLPFLYFNHAYGNGGIDTFSVEITKDCGSTYQTLFSKGGSQLWTMKPLYREPYNKSDWALDSFNLQAFLGQKVQFRLTYKSKTNDILFIDDFRVANRVVLNKDVLLVRSILPDNSPICPSDRKQIPVEVVIKNNGKVATDTILASFRVNNSSWITEKIIKKLNLDDSLRYTFIQLLTVPDTGSFLVTFAIGQSNEQNTVNDSTKKTLTVRREFSAPFVERFETQILPPKDWPAENTYYSIYEIKNESNVIGRNGRASAAIYFDYQSSERPVFLTTAPINLKDVRDPYLAFDISYSSFNHQGSLTVEVSTDCGITFQPIYYKRGDSLKTNELISYTGPTDANQWRRDSVSLLPYKTKDVMLRFVALNSFRGRAIYIDNIDVFNRNTPAKDAAISSIKSPIAGTFCPVGTPLLPIQIQVSNTGLAKLDTFIVSYKINNTPSVSDTVLKSLAFGESFIHTFKNLPSFPKGGTVSFFYIIKIKGDLDNRNDTMSNQVSFPNQFSLPFNENFDSGDISNGFGLPKEWQTNYIWITRQVIGSNGSLNNVYSYPTSSGSYPTGWINTPYIDLQKASKPYLSFDLSYARIDTFRNNRLRIEVSTDCGATFRPTSYDKSGKSLETFRTTEYYPQPLSAAHWRRDTVDLSAFKDSLVIIRFVGNNTNASNMYIDNVRVEAGFTKDISVLARVFPDTIPICYPQRNLPVRMTIRNDGITPIDTFKLSYRLDTEGVVTQTFIKRLNFRDTATFTFTQMMNVSTVGNHNLTLILNTNGDQNSINDTLKTTFRLRPEYKANVSEGLETTDFPPLDWTIQRSDPNFVTWQTAKVIGSRGDSSTVAYFETRFSSSPRSKGTEDALTSYPVDLTNVANPIALFDLAYLGSWNISGGGTDTSRASKIYYEDTLRIDISTDCGRTFRPTSYKKTKSDLTTAVKLNFNLPDIGSRLTSYTDWRRDTVDLSAYKGQVVQLRFVHIAPENYSTTILYLDNFQFVNHESKNLSLFNWVTPNDSTVLCNEEDFPVKVRLINEGKTAVDSFEIKYQIDNLPEIKEQAIVKINPKESTVYSFNNILRGIKSGDHVLKVIVRMAGDTVRLGDTLFRKITVNSIYSVPVIETFESTTSSFPPADWHVQDNNYFFNQNWRLAFGEDRDGRSTKTAIYNTVFTSITEQDALVTWRVDLKRMKNPYLVFDIAAFRHYLQDTDTFRIEYSTDCGRTFRPTGYKKSDSQFITDATPSLGSIKFPTRNQWRSDSVRLFNLKDSLVQFRFSATAKPTFGMVIHLDNIRVVELPTTKTAEISDTPQYSRVFPNPSTGDLTIEFIKNTGQQPVDCQLQNVQGQIVKREKLTNPTLENWQLQDLPAGMYFLFIGVNNQFEKHKIILIK